MELASLCVADRMHSVAGKRTHTVHRVHDHRIATVSDTVRNITSRIIDADEDPFAYTLKRIRFQLMINPLPPSVVLDALDIAGVMRELEESCLRNDDEVIAEDAFRLHCALHELAGEEAPLLLPERNGDTPIHLVVHQRCLLELAQRWLYDTWPLAVCVSALQKDSLFPKSLDSAHFIGAAQWLPSGCCLLHSPQVRHVHQWLFGCCLNRLEEPDLIRQHVRSSSGTGRRGATTVDVFRGPATSEPQKVDSVPVLIDDIPIKLGSIPLSGFKATDTEVDEEADEARKDVQARLMQVSGHGESSAPLAIFVECKKNGNCSPDILRVDLASRVILDVAFDDIHAGDRLLVNTGKTYTDLRRERARQMIEGGRSDLGPVLAWAGRFSRGSDGHDVYARLNGVLADWRERFGKFVLSQGDEESALRSLRRIADGRGVKKAMPTSPATLQSWLRWTICPRRKEALAIALHACGVQEAEHLNYHTALQTLSSSNLKAAMTMKREARQQLEEMLTKNAGRDTLGHRTSAIGRGDGPDGFRLHTVVDEPEPPQPIRSDMVGILLESRMF